MVLASSCNLARLNETPIYFNGCFLQLYTSVLEHARITVRPFMPTRLFSLIFGNDSREPYLDAY